VRSRRLLPSLAHHSNYGLEELAELRSSNQQQLWVSLLNDRLLSCSTAWVGTTPLSSLNARVCSSRILFCFLSRSRMECSSSMIVTWEYRERQLSRVEGRSQGRSISTGAEWEQSLSRRLDSGEPNSTWRLFSAYFQNRPTHALGSHH
jgi:hypothetical protein